MLPVPSKQIVRSRRFAALDEDIVVWIGCHVQTTNWFDDMARVPNQFAGAAIVFHAECSIRGATELLRTPPGSGQTHRAALI
jgi:hypothetical protein